jgi:hypothetical protein
VAPIAPTEERPRHGLLITAGVVGVLAAVVGVTAVFGGLRGRPNGPAKASAGHTIDQGLFKVEVLSAHLGRIKQFSGPSKNALVMTVHVTNLGDRSRGVTEFLDGMAAEPGPGRYVRADPGESTGEIAGSSTTEIHPRMPINVQVVWTLPDGAAPREVTVAFRQWSYGQSFTTDIFEWSVYKGSPVTAEVTIPVRPGARS